MKDKSNNKSTGLTFTSALQILFIALKLIGVIKWSWFWVLSPIWLNIIIVIILLVVMFI